MLTDIVMPLMSGHLLVERLRQLRPDLPVLFMSGYPDKSTQEGTRAFSAGFLQKPFTPEILLRKVRETLHAAPRTQC